MNKLVMAFFVLMSLANILIAQKPDKTKSPAKLAKEAADFEKSGDFQKAAVYYETASAGSKTENLDWLYQAGRCYLFVRDYANAAKCLEKVKDQDANPKFDKPGYKYAIALKQTGQYEPAKQAFEEFIAQYKGADSDQMRKTVDTEIKGCNFALKAQDHTDANISIQHLPASINSDKVEFAPIAFNEGVLYFTSTTSGVAAIYRTQKVSGNWTKPSVPDLFAGKMEKPNFGNGSFTPDGKRFYFTQCDLVDGGKPRCAIYAMVEEDGKWQAPFKLPDYVNAEGHSSTHPNVVIENDKEILYFSSDREGTKGGFDIWFCTRTAGSKGFNFTLPKNLGSNINTPGDDITPFYYTPTQTLYFASNGWVTAGGLDIFKSPGSQLKWEVAQNLGFPINSAADDLYYIVNESHGGGYFVSNRTFDPTKVATTNDDIFYFGQTKIEVTVKGSIYDCAKKDDKDKAPLTDVNVKLFEQTEEGGEELVENRMLAVGEYKFVLQPKKKYLVEMSREGYATSSFVINTFEFKRTETRQNDICLEIPTYDTKELTALIVPLAHNKREKAYLLPNMPPNDPKTKKAPVEGSALDKEFKRIEEIANLSPQHKVYYDGDGGDIIPFMEEEVIEPVDTGTTIVERPKGDVFPPESYIPEEGVVYRIQVAAVRKFRESSYKDLTKIDGHKMDFEPIEGGITRVLLIPSEKGTQGELAFDSKGQALEMLQTLLGTTRFKTAFVARYENGVRVGEGFRGLDEANNN